MRAAVTFHQYDVVEVRTFAHMKRVALLVMLALSLVAAKRRIVRSDPPTAVHYRGGPARTGVYEGSGPRVLHGATWNVPTAAATYASLVYADGTLYRADGNGHMAAYGATTGSLRWTSARLGTTLSAATVTADALYVGVAERSVFALNTANGSQLARYDVDAQVYATPLLDGGTLFAATESGALYAFDVARGVQLWRFAGPGPAHGHPAAWNGGVIYASGNSLICVDGSGHERWRFAGTSAFFSPSLAVANGVVYGSDFDAHFYAIDAEHGTQIWSYSGGGGFSAPVVASGLVIVGTVNPPSLLALHAAAGTVAWQTALSNFTEPIAAAGTLFGGTLNTAQNASPLATQQALAVDLLSGQLLWTMNVSGQVASGPAVGDGKLFVETRGNRLYAID